MIRFLSVHPRMRSGSKRCGNAFPKGYSSFAEKRRFSPDSGAQGYLLPIVFGCPDQAVEMAADMCRLSRGIGERNRPVKGSACLRAPAQLREECAARSKIVIISGQSIFQRRDHGERRLG